MNGKLWPYSVVAAFLAIPVIWIVLAVLVAAILLGGTFMAITALGLVHARSLSSGDPRRAIALMTAAFGLGQMIGPSFAGFAYGVGQSFLLPSLVAAGALLMVLAVGYALRRRF